MLTAVLEKLRFKKRPIIKDLSDKSVFLANARGEALPLSVEEALARKQNNFLGWHCAIGVENLHISADGVIFGGACLNNGALGNVYKKQFNLNKEWHVCTRKMCSCGADLQVRKVKELKYVPLTYEDMPENLVSEMKNPVYAAPVHQNMHRIHPMTMTWDIGRRCNYSCSYCHPNISNNHEAHKTKEQLEIAWQGLEENFLKGKKSKVVFTGGEPTLNPAFLDFVRMIVSQGHVVHITTNGSRLPSYYSDLLTLGNIGFSYHLEFARLEHYVKICKALIEQKQNLRLARLNWVGIRIMVGPGRYEEAKNVWETLKGLEGFNEVGIHLYMSPLYEIDSTRLMSYSPEELRKITQHA